MSRHRLSRWRSGRGAARARGFTLIEIMIVVLIIGVLLNIATPAFLHSRDSGQARTCVSNLHNINMAKEQWAIQNNISATSLPPILPNWLDQSGPGTGLQDFIRTNTQPACPTTGVSYVFGDVNTLPVCPYGGPVSSPTLRHSF